MADIDIIEQYDRVVTQEDYHYHGRLIKKGTLATCRGFLSDTMALIQYDYMNDHPIYISIPIFLLNKATIKELDAILDYKNLLPAIYYIGNRYTINNKVGAIEGIQMAQNEKYDIFHIKFDDGSLEKISRQMLDFNGSYLPIDLPEFE